MSPAHAQLLMVVPTYDEIENVDTLVATARENRADLNAAWAQLKQKEAEYKAARRARRQARVPSSSIPTSKLPSSATLWVTTEPTPIS